MNRVANLTSQPESRGSLWNRWDPHIHTPGTALNDQFPSTTPWNSFSAAVSGLQPAIRALGITDYLSIGNYEMARSVKADGGLREVGLIFPNVEIRFAIGTVKGSGINAHLLFSPDDPDHIDQIKRFLMSLTFRYSGNEFRCTKDDLIRLGKCYNNQIDDDTAAYREGVNQFKVSFDQLRQEWDKIDWIRDNCLIAVAAGQGDGTSGLREPEGAFTALRTSIEAFAHIIFSGNPKDREFWLGRGAVSPEELEAKWGGLKPCLHGSDAHAIDRVGKPDGERYCWIKGDLTFETLRQACLEPECRVSIGPEPPRGSRPSNTMQHISVTNAEWVTPQTIQLNAGLVAVIGARGSGKTALADLIAAGGLAISNRMNERSFIVRAREFLSNSKAEVTWESGETTGNDLSAPEYEEIWETPRVQYLSQQFVDQLCSSEGLNDTLLDEIHRVLFNAHPVDEREGTTDFDELYNLRCRQAVGQRENCEEELEEVAGLLLEERQRQQTLPALRKQKAELVDQIAKDFKDRDSLVRKGQEERLQQHQAVSTALQIRRSQLEALQRQHRSLNALRTEVNNFQTHKAQSYLNRLKQENPDASLSDPEWARFLPEIASDTDVWLRTKIQQVASDSASLAGAAPSPRSESDVEKSFLPNNPDLLALTVALLNAESSRLQQLIGIDSANAKKFAALNNKIANSQKNLKSIEKQIEHAEGADARCKLLIQRRNGIYAQVFASIELLEAELLRLYSPLEAYLESAAGVLNKLRFVVRRAVDIEKWTTNGEALLDLRRDGPFRGRGTLLAAVEEHLLPAWSTGNAQTVAQAMHDFIESYADDIKKHRRDGVDGREWGVSISKWLHGTDHVTVSYGLQYDGVDIERLSPGTRGIVLLLLYLAVDQEDDRPLIIDQPEENLDPQSIFQELVGRFKQAKARRQIIVVTHNANLVVNTDADQVIVASAGSHQPGNLPTITYEAGGIENPRIRQAVCDIMEGGERAFRARAKRLRVEFTPNTTTQH